MTIRQYIVAAIAVILLAEIGGNAARADDDSAALAQQLTNPLAALISLPIKTDYNSGYGAKGNGYQTVTTVQPVIPIRLNEDWNVISRTIVPYVWDQKNISPVGPSGHQSGFADSSQSLFFSPANPLPLGDLGNLVWGVGPVFGFPTGSASPFLGSGRWTLGPTAVALLMNNGWTTGALVSQSWDIGGDSDRSKVNSTFIQPFVSYTTNAAWTFTLNSESTYNWETNDWSIPINAMAAKLVKFGNQPVSLQAGVRYWANSPDGGPEGWGARAQVTFLFPTGG